MTEQIDLHPAEASLLLSQPAEPEDRGNVFGFHELMGFWATARCPLRCQHCMFSSSLEEQDIPDLKDLLDWLEQASQTGRIRLVSFTGGEPFYVFDKLRAMVARAAALDLRVNVVTNAYWATSKEQARTLLSQLEGLTDLYVSVDEFHAMHVPLSHVLSVGQVAYELGLRVALAVSYCRREDYLKFRFQLERLLEIPIPIVPVQIVRQGNARWLGQKRFDLSEQIPRGPCHGTNVPMVDKDGTVYACCEPPISAKVTYNPLILGNLHQEPLQTILARAENSAYIRALRTQGPGHLAQLAIDRGLGHKLKRLYPRDSICEVCHDLVQDKALLKVVEEELEPPQVQREVATYQCAARKDLVCP